MQRRYRRDYAIYVGGVVLCGDKVLLVRLTREEAKNDWAIPGRFVEQRETIDTGVQREVIEEAGVRVELQGLIAARVGEVSILCTVV